MSKIIMLILLVANIALSNSASATAIINGTFDTDLSGWSVVTNGGTAQWDAGQAVLSTGSDFTPFSSVLVQGDDGTFSFNNPILLTAGNDFFKFDALFSTLAADILESGGGLADNLQVWLYDANDATGSHDALIASIDALTSSTSFSFDLSAFIGRSVAFSFELNDENDGTNSKVALDNIRFEQRIDQGTVPEPETLMLLALGLLGLSVNLRRK